MTRPAVSRAKVTSTTNGTGSFVLGAAVSGEHVQGFLSSLNGHVVTYAIDHMTEGNGEWETGIGTYTSGTATLTRDFVDGSSTGSKVSFSSGTKHVRITDIASIGVPQFSTGDPAATDDIGLGYVAYRSYWVNTTSGKLFLCTTHTDNAAVWKQIATLEDISAVSIADDAVTNAKLANMAAWSVKLRNAATTGDPSDAALANINEELTPTTGDKVLLFLATGEIRVADVGNLPSSAGEGTASNIGLDGVGVFDAKVGADFQFRHIAPASDKLTVVLNDNGSPSTPDIDIDIVEANLDIPAESITSGFINSSRISQSSVTQHMGRFKPVDGTAAGSNITNIVNSNAGQTIKIDQNATLDNAFGTTSLSPDGAWVILNNVHATNTVTITVEPGAGSPTVTGTINGATTYQIPPGGEIMLRCVVNPGDVPTCDARGDSVQINFGARVVWGNLARVVLGVTGTLTVADHLGALVRTAGNITIPTTPGFHCLVKAGGSGHTITFNATVTAGGTSGQVCSVFVQEATIAIITPWTTPQTLT